MTRAAAIHPEILANYHSLFLHLLLEIIHKYLQAASSKPARPQLPNRSNRLVICYVITNLRFRVCAFMVHNIIVFILPQLLCRVLVHLLPMFNFYSFIHNLFSSLTFFNSRTSSPSITAFISCSWAVKKRSLRITTYRQASDRVRNGVGLDAKPLLCRKANISLFFAASFA